MKYLRPWLRSTRLRAAAGALLLLAAVVTGLLAWEMRTSALASRFFSRHASKLGWSVRDGGCSHPLPAMPGPYDERRGYDRLPQIRERLAANGFAVTRQACPSEALSRLVGWGIAPPYHEKVAAGIEIVGRAGNELYRHWAADLRFASLDDIPPVVVRSLLYVEDRQLLDEDSPQLNPAVDWSRFVRAGLQYSGALGSDPRGRLGGSTLATQLAKFRHSPQGRTGGIDDKLNQMLAASLRAYREGPDTRAARREIILDYLNGLPLGAVPGEGEVNGLLQGLVAWFGVDRQSWLDAMALPETATGLESKARAYKQALALVLATRRPQSYLRERHDLLERRVALYLDLLARDGIVSPELAAAARRVPLQLDTDSARPRRSSFVERKAVNLVRSRVRQLVGAPDLYALDRYDLRVETRIDAMAQARVSQVLESLSDPSFLAANGFYGHRLLSGREPGRVLYTFLLYEATPEGNALLVHADNLDQPLDANRGVMLEMGSTAKLRTLANYLLVVAELRERNLGAPVDSLRATALHSPDPIGRWVAGWLQAHPQATLRETLEASLERPFSSDPDAIFWTGGGLHRFGNFDAGTRGSMPLRQGFIHSVNLVHVRLMRELVHHYEAELGYDEEELLARADHPGRAPLLEAAMERETREVLHRDYRKHTEAPRGFPRDPQAAASPLEAWLLRHLQEHPDASWQEVVARSADARREDAAWIYTTRRKRGQDQRIRTELERRAFERIHTVWKTLGFPFDSMVPSLASAIGSSADRPEALAKLMGIIQNGGVSRPMQPLAALHFAAGTPYEMRVEPVDTSVRLLAPEVAAVLRELLFDVVDRGTARRVAKVLHGADGNEVRVGGKTGSGDNRFERFDARGRLLSSRAINRTASFVFLIEDRYFGVVTASVLGEEAGEYSFTSSLALQTLKALAPAIEPLVQLARAPAAEALAAATSPASQVLVGSHLEADMQLGAAAPLFGSSLAGSAALVEAPPAPPAPRRVTSRRAVPVSSIRRSLR